MSYIYKSHHIIWCMILLFLYIIWYCDSDSDIYSRLVIVVIATWDITSLFFTQVQIKKRIEKNGDKLKKKNKRNLNNRREIEKEQVYHL